jgi:hypothetical protein
MELAYFYSFLYGIPQKGIIYTSPTGLVHCIQSTGRNTNPALCPLLSLLPFSFPFPFLLLPSGPPTKA